MEQLTYSLLVGTQNDTATLENSWHFLKNLKCAPTLWLSHSTPRHLSKRNECIWPHKDLYPNIHSSFICSRQKLRTIQMCINMTNNPNVHKQANKQCVLSPYNGILHSNKTEWVIGKCIMCFIIVRGRSFGKKDMIPFIWNSITESRSQIAWKHDWRGMN